MSANPPSPDPPRDEEEIARLVALAALNESVPLNHSLFGNSSLTMQLQSEVFVLRHNLRLMPSSSTNRLRGTPA